MTPTTGDWGTGDSMSEYLFSLTVSHLLSSHHDPISLEVAMFPTAVSPKGGSSSKALVFTVCQTHNFLLVP